METIFAQVVADAWAVAPEDVIISLADTAGIPIGFGTIASRSTVTLSAAIHHASEHLRQKAFAIAANLLECAPADLELRDGGVGVVGVPGAAVSLAKLAQAARPGWDHGRPPGVEAGLEETHYWEPPTVTWSYAAHVAIVELDPETGQVRIDKYVVAHDCGVVVNPLLVEGQIAGGTAQGIGGILLEELAYDADGQLLTGSLMDYLLPTASDIPDIQMIHQHSPVAAQPARRQGGWRRRRGGTPGGHRQRNLRRPRAVRGRVQRDPDKAATDRAGGPDGKSPVQLVIRPRRLEPDAARFASSVNATLRHLRQDVMLGPIR